MPEPTPFLEPEFRHEYEAERLRWLRVRFLWFAGSLGSLWAAGSAVLIALALVAPGSISKAAALTIPAGVLKAALFGIPFFRVLRAKLPPPARETIIRYVFWMLVGYSLVQLIPARAFAEILTRFARSAGAESVSLGAAVPVVIQTLLIHFLASLLIPWTPREALRPILPFMAVVIAGSVVAAAVGDSGVETVPAAALVMALIITPGLLVCRLRHSRFSRRFEDRAVRARYGELRHELATARRIHDRLFPAPIRDGPVRLDYVYEPMRHIGGDFLFVGSDPSPGAAPGGDAGGPLSVLLIDVTGHGIAAALAVNRLHGELSRIFGSESDPPPGRVLAELNRYIHLTMSRDTVFATAICMRIDPAAGEVRWANAGHPPALLRAGAGGIHRLESTTFLLGAADPDEFDASERAAAFRPGDAILAYTDGAIEARLGAGGMLGLRGLEDLAAAPAAASGDDGWCSAVLEGIKALRDGPAEDDTLLVRIARPAAGAAAPG